MANGMAILYAHRVKRGAIKLDEVPNRDNLPKRVRQYMIEKGWLEKAEEAETVTPAVEEKPAKSGIPGMQWGFDKDDTDEVTEEDSDERDGD